MLTNIDLYAEVKKELSASDEQNKVTLQALTNEIEELLTLQFIREDILTAAGYHQLKFHRFFTLNTKYNAVRKRFSCNSFEELKEKLLCMSISDYFKQMTSEPFQFRVYQWGRRCLEAFSDESPGQILKSLYIKCGICGDYLSEKYTKELTFYFRICYQLFSEIISMDKNGDKSVSVFKEQFQADEILLHLCHLISMHTNDFETEEKYEMADMFCQLNLYANFDLSILGIDKSIKECNQFAYLFLKKYIPPLYGLSQRAKEYIEDLPFEREQCFAFDRESVMNYFEKKGYQHVEPLVDFHINFGGYCLTIDREYQENDNRHSFELALFNNKNELIWEYDEDGECRFYCGNHGCAQANFSINLKGEIFVDDEQILCSSYFKLIEQYAIDNQFKYEFSFYRCVENSLVEEYMKQNQFTVIPECSDPYNMYYTNDVVVIQYGTEWGGTERFLHLFTQDETIGAKAVEGFKHLLLEEPETPILSIQTYMKELYKGKK